MDPAGGAASRRAKDAKRKKGERAAKKIPFFLPYLPFLATILFEAATWDVVAAASFYLVRCLGAGKLPYASLDACVLIYFLCTLDCDVCLGTPQSSRGDG
jgi:hypothetical protein